MSLTTAQVNYAFNLLVRELIKAGAMTFTKPELKQPLADAEAWADKPAVKSSFNSDLPAGDFKSNATVADKAAALAFALISIVVKNTEQERVDYAFNLLVSELLKSGPMGYTKTDLKAVLLAAINWVETPAVKSDFNGDLTAGNFKSNATADEKRLVLAYSLLSKLRA